MVVKRVRGYVGWHIFPVRVACSRLALWLDKWDERGGASFSFFGLAGLLGCWIASLPPYCTLDFPIQYQRVLYLQYTTRTLLFIQYQRASPTPISHLPTARIPNPSIPSSPINPPHPTTPSPPQRPPLPLLPFPSNPPNTSHPPNPPPPRPQECPSTFPSRPAPWNGHPHLPHPSLPAGLRQMPAESGHSPLWRGDGR